MTGILALVGSLYPVSSVTINIIDRTVAKIVTGGTATATYTIDNDGTVKNHIPATLETWLGGSGGAVADYDVRATYTSGTSPSGSALAAWLNCASDRSWSQTNSAQDGSTVSGVILVEIRNATTLVVMDSASITISATSDP